MTRIAVLVAALAAALFTAPAAFAATYVVDSPGPTSPAAVTACTNHTAGCTLPAAIQVANGSTGVTDAITFTGAGTAPGPFASPLPAVMDQLVIDGGGNTTVSFAAAATGALLDVTAANSTVKAIRFTGGGSGTVLNLSGSGDRADSVTVQNTAANGIAIGGPNAAVSAPEISGASGSGIVINGSGATINGGHIHGNGADGVAIGGQNDTVTHVVIYGNGGKPIATGPGANGGIAPPQNLRVGPRRADGSLPLTGNASGTVELWSGNPFSSSAPSFADSFSAGGDFTYNFPSEPEPGSVYAASVTGGNGSSEFATVTVPSDVSSPFVTFARALDTGNVRVNFSEPVDPASVQVQDFKLSMAGADRPISGFSLTPDGIGVTLTSSGWRAGEAGYVDLTGAGAITDSSGNAMLTAPRMRVAAAPGDFVAPLGARLAVTPKTICLTHGRHCRKTGMTIRFVSSEPGKARLVIKRSNKTVGSRLYGNIVAGLNTLKFNGRLGSRKLRAGRYRLLMYVQDQVGNVTDQPPIILFNVRRVTR